MAGPAYHSVGSNLLEEARGFYDAVLGILGMKTFYDGADGSRIYGHPKTGMFTVLPPRDGHPATVGNGSMAGFAVDSRDQVDAFHATALKMGGTCEGPPGERVPGIYFAYCRDLDGNKLCAYKWD